MLALDKPLTIHEATGGHLQQITIAAAVADIKFFPRWDFLLRSFQFLAARIDPKNPTRSEMFMDVFGRASIAKTLILDDTGKLEQMNASVGYSHNEDVDSGDEIKTEAQKLDELPE